MIKIAKTKSKNPTDYFHTTSTTKKKTFWLAIKFQRFFTYNQPHIIYLIFFNIDPRLWSIYILHISFPFASPSKKIRILYTICLSPPPTKPFFSSSFALFLRHDFDFFVLRRRNPQRKSPNSLDCSIKSKKGIFLLLLGFNHPVIEWVLGSLSFTMIHLLLRLVTGIEIYWILV